ncbi:FG-GAP-like repeat-containing protein [candidate division KSB1 bacterium]
MRLRKSILFKASVLIIFVIITLIICVCGKKTDETEVIFNDPGVSILLLMNRPYGANYFLNRDVFEQYGWNLTHAGVSDSIPFCWQPANKTFFLPTDIHVTEISDVTKYDCIAIIPSPGDFREVPNSFGELLNSPEAINLISEAEKKGIPVWTICSGVRVLTKADVIRGKRVTGGKRFQPEYEAAGATFVGKDCMSFFLLIACAYNQKLSFNELSPISFEKSPQVFASTRTIQIGPGDFDGDGDLDAVFSNMGLSYSQVLINNGTGHFIDTKQNLTRLGHGVGVGDLDNDGNLDLFIPCATFGEHHKGSVIYLNDGKSLVRDTGQELEDFEISGTGVELSDIDGDNDLDAMVNYYDASNRIYFNNSQGRFVFKWNTFPTLSAFGDLNSDGDIDLFVKEMKVGYKTLLNNGACHFTESWQLSDSTVIWGFVSLGDIDSDGDLDSIIPNGDNTRSHQTAIFINDGKGNFTDSKQRLGVTKFASIGLADLNNNSHLDVIIANFGLPTVVWLNNGKGFSLIWA